MKTMKQKVYKHLAMTLLARNNCVESSNKEWEERHEDTLDKIEKNHLPSGSGFDSETIFNKSQSKPEKLILHTSFHHMDGNGSFNGWSEHMITVTPSLVFGIEIEITKDDDYRKEMKENYKEAIKGLGEKEIEEGEFHCYNEDYFIDYMHEVFHEALMTEIEHPRKEKRPMQQQKPPSRDHDNPVQDWTTPELRRALAKPDCYSDQDMHEVETELRRRT